MRLLTAMSAAYVAFRKAYLAANSDRTQSQDVFASLAARRLRYALYWALYEGTAYDAGENAVHSWSHAWKAQSGIYRPTRGIFNPAHRTAEVNVSLIHGGTLDPSAGDGLSVPSALPIDTDNEAIRPAIARLWRDSNWQGRKSIWTRNGIICGETPVRVIDDTIKGRVYLRPFHPRTLADWTTDEVGNVRSYVIEEDREDPLASALSLLSLGESRKQCVYTETAERLGENVIYRTYRDHKPYAWNGESWEWEVPYGFVPMVVVKHLDFGHPFCGLGEYAAALAKIVEGDDLGSKLGDSVRQAVEAIWFFAGFKQADIDAGLKRKANAKEGSTGDPLRQISHSITATDAQAKAQALVPPIDVGGVADYLKLFLDDRLQDYPELKYDRLLTSGEVSGEALRQARKPAEAKIQERRTGYDDGLVRAMQMAIAIGGFRGYEGYAGFGLESYAAGDLAMRISSRAVYAGDPMDAFQEDLVEAQAETAKAQAVSAWVAAGLDLKAALVRVGISESEIAEILAARATTPKATPGEVS